MSSAILYEYPLNERIRAFLRLEYFFLQIQHFLAGTTSIDTQAGIAVLIEILTVLERNDIRTEVLKELDRHTLALSRLLDTPAVDRQRLNQILEKLTTQTQQLQRIPNKLGFDMRDKELLSSIRQRTVIAVGTCGFDLPAYHYLLNQPTKVHNEYLSRYLSEFKPLQESIDLLLSLLRSSALFDRQAAEGGFYQRTLDPQNPCLLLRICMPPHCGVYPEVSGSKHRVNLRFLAFSETERPKQVDHRQEFDISCCVL
jgi:cell division protein ZapD